MSIGLITGKFAPLHNGHIELINQAASSVDDLYVILSFDQKWLNTLSEDLQDKLSLQNRLLWLKRTYNDIPHVHISYIDETDCEPYPDGWKEWASLVAYSLRNDFVLPIPSNEVTDIFASEPDYKDGWNTYFPQSEFHVVDEARREIHISATQIRRDVYNNWEFLPSIVRRDFALKVCVIGPESTGKTTLVKYLAKRFNTSWVEEFGRTFVENDLCGDESLLQPAHYPYIAMKQKIMEDAELSTCNRVLFIDTNAVVTEQFLREYHNEEDSIVTAIAEQEQYDLILALWPNVKWVDDGLRSLKSDTKRKELFFNQTFAHADRGKNVIEIHSSDYNQRFNTAVGWVKALFETTTEERKE